MGEWRDQAYQNDCAPKVSDSASIFLNDLRAPRQKALAHFAWSETTTRYGRVVFPATASNERETQDTFGPESSIGSSL